MIVCCSPLLSESELPGGPSVLCTHYEREAAPDPFAVPLPLAGCFSVQHVGRAEAWAWVEQDPQPAAYAANGIDTDTQCQEPAAAQLEVSRFGDSGLVSISSCIIYIIFLSVDPRLYLLDPKLTVISINILFFWWTLNCREYKRKQKWYVFIYIYI